jgi:hypothetical protein
MLRLNHTDNKAIGAQPSGGETGDGRMSGTNLIAPAENSLALR